MKNFLSLFSTVKLIEIIVDTCIILQIIKTFHRDFVLYTRTIWNYFYTILEIWELFLYYFGGFVGTIVGGFCGTIIRALLMANDNLVTDTSKDGLERRKQILRKEDLSLHVQRSCIGTSC